MLRLGKTDDTSSESATPSWLEYASYVAIVLAVLGLIILYVQEFKHFSRLLNPGYLVWGAVIFGALFGAFWGYRFRQRAEDLTERIQIYVFFILISIFFMPLFASLSNRLLAYAPVQQEQAELFQANAYISRAFGLIEGENTDPSGYNVFFVYQNELYKVSVEELWFETTEEGAQIPLPVQRGLWGVRYIKL